MNFIVSSSAWFEPGFPAGSLLTHMQFGLGSPARVDSGCNTGDCGQLPASAAWKRSTQAGAFISRQPSGIATIENRRHWFVGT